jgi:hypothetical protein
MKRAATTLLTTGFILLLSTSLWSAQPAGEPGPGHAVAAAQAPDHAAAGKKDTDPDVSFNTNTLKYHCPSCTWAKRCTKNCIKIKLSEAKERGGVACKSCGGTC